MSVAFENVIGYDEIKNELSRYCAILNSYHQDYYFEKLAIKEPRGILLYGKPGIGKTLMAESFIKECRRTSFTIRKDRPDGEFVNYIKETFDKAKEAEPSIVFLDDFP